MYGYRTKMYSETSADKFMVISHTYFCSDTFLNGIWFNSI